MGLGELAADQPDQLDQFLPQQGGLAPGDGQAGGFPGVQQLDEAQVLLPHIRGVVARGLGTHETQAVAAVGDKQAVVRGARLVEHHHPAAGLDEDHVPIPQFGQVLRGNIHHRGNAVYQGLVHVPPARMARRRRRARRR
jgi:hypothetical protein